MQLFIVKRRYTDVEMSCCDQSKTKEKEKNGGGGSSDRGILIVGYHPIEPPRLIESKNAERW